jgi:hypothetical protein
MCCQTDPTLSPFGLIPAFLLAIRKHDGSRLPERPCVDPSWHVIYPDLSRSFLHLMINNVFWLGQSPIGKLSGDGIASEAPRPLAHPARGVPYIHHYPSVYPIVLMRLWIVHTCTTITHRRFFYLFLTGIKSY